MENRSSSNSRKRALSASPGYSELDLANLMRHSPTSLQLLNAAAASTANNGSPSSSGSYGRLSGKNHDQIIQRHSVGKLSKNVSFFHAWIWAPKWYFGGVGSSILVNMRLFCLIFKHCDPSRKYAKLIEIFLICYLRCQQSSVARSSSSFVSPSAIASTFATHFTLLVTQPKFIYTFLLAT